MRILGVDPSQNLGLALLVDGTFTHGEVISARGPETIRVLAERFGGVLLELAPDLVAIEEPRVDHSMWTKKSGLTTEQAISHTRSKQAATHQLWRLYSRLANECGMRRIPVAWEVTPLEAKGALGAWGMTDAETVEWFNRWHRTALAKGDVHIARACGAAYRADQDLKLQRAMAEEERGE